VTPQQPGPALPVDAGDRERTVRLAQHRQNPHAPPIRQARHATGEPTPSRAPGPRACWPPPRLSAGPSFLTDGGGVALACSALLLPVVAPASFSRDDHAAGAVQQRPTAPATPFPHRRSRYNRPRVPARSAAAKRLIAASAAVSATCLDLPTKPRPSPAFWPEPAAQIAGSAWNARTGRSVRVAHLAATESIAARFGARRVLPSCLQARCSACSSRLWNSWLPWGRVQPAAKAVTAASSAGERLVRSWRRTPVWGLGTGWAAVGQAGGAKNSRAIPSGSRKETPEP
jgi:hypothetical protein